MVSREQIYFNVKFNHVVALHMKGEKRVDGLSSLIYIVYDLLLSKKEEEQLLHNISQKIDTQGILRIKAIRTSEVDLSTKDSEPQEYTINTMDIVGFEKVG